MAAPAPHYCNYYNNAGAQATEVATPAALSLTTKNAAAVRGKRSKKDPDAPKRPMSAFLNLGIEKAFEKCYVKVC